MGYDAGWKVYLSDDERYADVINGICCKGKQEVKAENLQEMDTQTGFWRKPGFIRSLQIRRKSMVKIRDCVRRVAFGMNFMVAGVENQETIDYSIPLRNMEYDVGEYGRQAAKIRREVRRNRKGLSRGEYLYGFRRDSRLHPAVTIILYYGLKPWNGPRSLHEMMDFTDIPEELQKMAADYRINLVEIRKLKDTSMFQTDVRQVFDFIRCSEDKEALARLVENDTYYKNMEEDAFDVVAQYTNAAELINAKEYYRKDGKVDMCTAITELIADGRQAGREEGRRSVLINMIRRGMSDADIIAIAECDQTLVDELRRTLDM